MFFGLSMIARSWGIVKFTCRDCHVTWSEATSVPSGGIEDSTGNRIQENDDEVNAVQEDKGEASIEDGATPHRAYHGDWRLRRRRACVAYFLDGAKL